MAASVDRDPRRRSCRRGHLLAAMPTDLGRRLYHALKLLGRGLLGVKADPLDLEARLDCQLGAWMSMVGSQTGVPKGASHGIGHVLGGTAHVPHGYTSCVMLPHVLRFNHAVNAER